MVHYECGFDPYYDARLKFDIFYYLIALLFLIFDFEILFLYPYSYRRFYSLDSFIVYFIFYLLFCIGYLFERR